MPARPGFDQRGRGDRQRRLGQQVQGDRPAQRATDQPEWPVAERQLRPQRRQRGRELLDRLPDEGSR